MYAQAPSVLTWSCALMCTLTGTTITRQNNNFKGWNSSLKGQPCPRIMRCDSTLSRCICSEHCRRPATWPPDLFPFQTALCIRMVIKWKKGDIQKEPLLRKMRKKCQRGGRRRRSQLRTLEQLTAICRSHVATRNSLMSSSEERV